MASNKKIVVGVIGAGAVAGVFLAMKKGTKVASKISSKLPDIKKQKRTPQTPPAPPPPPARPKTTSKSSPILQTIKKGIGAGVQISKNFNTTEFLTSKLAPELKEWVIPADHFDNLELLVNKILQPARDKFGPIKITGGYRPTAFRNSKGQSFTDLLKKAGYQPAADSDHQYAQAADIYPLTISNMIPLWGWLKANPYVRQAIMYFKTTPQGVKLQQIHVAVATKTRPIIKGANHWFYVLDGKRTETLPM